ncbi:S8 family serine peptidase [Chitinophaga sp. 22321]|uniref:S8 family serine peptidase n=1 Tax=Chitinophaga hostae TaxID=2831022 RepID=A0ABS5JA54_9BACT|nr:S8 family serine peptidase [Chitinophaga hostae]MBS0032094.1 S8 family serine peptidase [Chitinophaga hostae]
MKKIAIIDSGISMTHAIFNNKRISGVTIKEQNGSISYESDYNDDDGHGTAIAGIICSWQSDVELVIVKLSSDSAISEQLLCEGIRWCLTATSAEIINISMGIVARVPSTTLYDLCLSAYLKGILIVAAAFHDPAVSCYPAYFPFVTGVYTAVNGRCREYKYLGTGAINVLAYGLPQSVHWTNGTTQTVSGTSYAAAFFTAALAEMKEISERENSSLLSKILSYSTSTLIPIKPFPAVEEKDIVHYLQSPLIRYRHSVADSLGITGTTAPFLAGGPADTRLLTAANLVATLPEIDTLIVLPHAADVPDNILVNEYKAIKEAAIKGKNIAVSHDELLPYVTALTSIVPHYPKLLLHPGNTPVTPYLGHETGLPRNQTPVLASYGATADWQYLFFKRILKGVLEENGYSSFYITESLLSNHLPGEICFSRHLNAGQDQVALNNLYRHVQAQFTPDLIVYMVASSSVYEYSHKAIAHLADARPDGVILHLTGKEPQEWIAATFRQLTSTFRETFFLCLLADDICQESYTRIQQLFRNTATNGCCLLMLSDPVPLLDAIRHFFS